LIQQDDILQASILIVDDQDANIRLLEGMLRIAGYTSVQSTNNPHGVCALHAKHHYGLILLDLHMPGMNGFEVMDGLKKIEGDGYLPVLVVTAQLDKELQTLQAGATDFVSKPFKVAEVLARVHNLLEVRLLHDESKRYSSELEQKIKEVEASRELIRHKSDEILILYDKVLAEKKRATELSLQPGVMVGVEKDERLGTHWLRSLMLRHHWLQINLLTTFAAAAVVLLFQGTIDRLLILTIFLPVLAGQSLNTGSQALAITLRGIALGELKSGKENSLLKKEALLGLMNGTMVGLMAAIGMYVIASARHLNHAPILSAVVLIAMIGSCVISGICGAIVPLILKRLGIDPATASSILLSTVTDVVSIGMLLGLASIMVK